MRCPSASRCYIALPMMATLSLLACGNNNRQSSCTIANVISLASDDSQYLAQIKKFSCDMGSEYQYVLVVGSKTLHDNRSWTFKTRIESDVRSAPSPTISWSNGHMLVVRVRSRTISGALTEHIGQDLILETIYTPTNPDAFPNYF